MKKKRICLLLIILSIFLFKIDVNAAGTCTKDEKQILQVETQNISITYELVHETDERSDLEYYYKITIDGYSNNLLIKEGNAIYDHSYINANGELIINKAYRMGEKVVFNIIGNTNNKCSGEAIATKVVNLPYYNKYSERDECKGLSEYDICKSNVNSSNITEEIFLKKIAEANATEKEKNKKEPEKEETLVVKVINFYKDNLIITLPITIIILVLLVLIVYKKNKKDKSKIKIDLDKM